KAPPVPFTIRLRPEGSYQAMPHPSRWASSGEWSDCASRERSERTSQGSALSGWVASSPNKRHIGPAHHGPIDKAPRRGLKRLPPRKQVFYRSVGLERSYHPMALIEVTPAARDQVVKI